MARLEATIVARGTWLYDGSTIRPVVIMKRPAELAGSRHIEEEASPPTSPSGFVLDAASPIPATPDGFVYYVSEGSGGEFPTLEAAKAWLDAQPWGPITWK